MVQRNVAWTGWKTAEDDDPLQEEAELDEIVQMVGMDALSPGPTD